MMCLEGILSPDLSVNEYEPSMRDSSRAVSTLSSFMVIYRACGRALVVGCEKAGKEEGEREGGRRKERGGRGDGSYLSV